MFDHLRSQLAGFLSVLPSAEPDPAPKARPNLEQLDGRVMPNASILVSWFDSHYGSNPYGADSATVGVSHVDTATGAETVVYSAPADGTPATQFSGGFTKPLGVAGAGGNVFIATSKPGTTPNSFRGVGAADDASTIVKIDPATGAATPLLTKGRETTGLSTTADGKLLVSWFDGVYGNNPYGPESATAGVSTVDPASGVEAVVYSAPAAGTPATQSGGGFTRTFGVAQAAGKLFAATSHAGERGYPGYPAFPPYYPAQPATPPKDDSSTVLSIDPATGASTPLLAKGRETTGLSTTADGKLLVSWFDGVYGNNPYGPESATAGVSTVDPTTGVEAVVYSQAVPGLPRQQYDRDQTGAVRPVAVVGTGDGIFVATSQARVFSGTNPYDAGDDTSTISHVAPPDASTPLLTKNRETLGLAADFVAAPLVDLVATKLAWNVNRGPGVANPQRGLDATYAVRNPASPLDVPVAFYWATGTTFASRIGTALHDGSPPAGAPVTTSGDFTLNEPGRWGTPPADAKFVLMVLDPPDADHPNGLVAEADETNNVSAIPLHSPGEVLAGSVQAAPAGAATITAAFTPGAGLKLTLSEAEVALGVDHFNWRQQVSGLPAGWRPFTLANLDYARLGDGGSNVTLGLADGRPVFRYADGGQIIASTPAGVPFTDPLLADSGEPQAKLTRAFIYSNGTVDKVIVWPNGDFTAGGQAYAGPAPDVASLFYNEDGRADARGVLAHSLPGLLTFEDTPLNPAAAFNLGGALRFDTSLVGVPYNESDLFSYHDFLVSRGGGQPFPPFAESDLVKYRFFTEGGYGTNFSWGTNAAHGVGQPVGWGAGERDRPAVVGGGVFGVQSDAGAVAPGFPAAAPAVAAVPASPADISQRAGSLGTPQFAVGLSGGGVTVYNADKSPGLTASPFPANAASQAGVRTATADFNGDGVPDLVTGTGPGVASSIRVLDGKTQQELFAFAPFEASFTGGVFVAVGDLNRDGVPDLVVTPDQGGGPRVRVFSGRDFGQIADFFGIDDPAFRGGARVAVGDLTGDGVPDLIVAAGFGGGPRVAVFDGMSLGGGKFNTKPVGDFFAYEDTLRNGAYVAAGDVTGDGRGDLVTGGGPGGGPRVSVFDGRSLIGGNTTTRYADFFAGDTAGRDGVRVAVKDLDGDAFADVVTVPGSGKTLTAYAGKSQPVGGAAAFTLDLADVGPNGAYVG